MKKFELLTTDTKDLFGRKLFRIRALRDFGNVKAGELGGYVEKEGNLSHDGNAWVYNDAKIYGNAWVCDYAKICGNAEIYDNAWIYGGAWVYNDAKIYGNARVCNYAEIYGDAKIYGNARVCNYAVISGDADYLCFKGLGSFNRNTTFFKCKDGSIGVTCGCFSGSLVEFQAKVKETHGDNKYAREYLKAVEVVKIHFDLEESE